MVNRRADWLLDGREEIRDYLNDASDYKLRKWVADGMPVRIEGNSWTAHVCNLDDWFRVYTRQRGCIEVYDED
ncbi:MAG: hypothetical protein CR984_04010 [Proteobacteria bacterium]|nr:MAG: hypothetical protein CR984_04010 [Pseudomonadota bacterium]